MRPYYIVLGLQGGTLLKTRVTDLAPEKWVYVAGPYATDADASRDLAALRKVN